MSKDRPVEASVSKKRPQVSGLASHQAVGSRDTPFLSQGTRLDYYRKKTDWTLAGRGERLGAHLLDGLMNLFLFFGFLAILGVLGRLNEPAKWQDIILILAAAFASFFALHTYLLAKRGQTVGKWILGIQIVNKHTAEILPFFKLIILRFLPFWGIAFVPWLNWFAFVDVLFIFREDRRCLHDMLAGTKVIHCRRWERANIYRRKKIERLRKNPIDSS